MTRNEQLQAWWDSCVIRDDGIAGAERCANTIIKNQATYEAVSKETSIPWWLIGMLHSMESNFDFGTWLANGDDIRYPTVRIPKGLHCDGSWRDGAVVSLKYRNDARAKWDILSILDYCEAYNGYGYSDRGLPSQYVWSFTNIEKPGRYVKDGVWDPSVMSGQIGCAAMLKALAKKITLPFTQDKRTLADVDWIEFTRNELGDSVLIAYAGAEPKVLLTTNYKSDIIKFFNDYPGAKTVRVSPAGKKVPRLGYTRGEEPAPTDGNNSSTPTGGNNSLMGKAVVIATTEADIVVSGPDAKKYWSKFANNRIPWCAAFVTWCLEQAGLNVPADTPKGMDGYQFCLVEAWQQWAMAMGFWIEGGTTVIPNRGDIVIFDWDGATHPDIIDDWDDHVGFAIADMGNGYVKCVEGNVNDSTAYMLRNKELIQGYIRIPDTFLF